MEPQRDLEKCRRLAELYEKKLLPASLNTA